MAGHAGDGGNRVAFVVLFEGKVFFVDPTGHLVHMTGNIFFRLGIAGKIELVGSTVCGGGMTKITFYPKGGFPPVHYLFQIVMADVLGQHLEIMFGLWIVLGTERCHAKYDQ